MRHIYLLICVFFIVFAKAQAPFWTEGFGNSATCVQGTLANNFATANGTWVVTSIADSTDHNVWYISATEAGMAVGTCGSGCLTTPTLLNNTLHIGNVSTSPGAAAFCPTGDCGAAYDAGGFCGTIGCVTTSDRAESPLINCTGKTNIILNFNFIQSGQAGVDFTKVMYTANGGGLWTALTTLSQSNNSTCPSAGGDSTGLWTHFTMALPASANNNPNVKIGFWWVNNDDGIGTDPSVAIDSIEMIACTTPTITVAQTGTVCLGESTATLTASSTLAGTTYTWTPTTGLAPTTGSVVVASPNSTTVYSVTGAVGTCSATATTTVTVYQPPIVTVPSQTICEGNAITLTATSNSVITTYTWIPSGTLSSSTGSSVVANPTVTTSYTVGAIDAQGCIGAAFPSVTVITPTSCSVTATSNDTVYAGNTISLNATPVTTGTNCPIVGAATYSWSGPNTFTSTTQNPTIHFSSLPMAGVYSVTLTTGGVTCTATTSIVIDTLTVKIFSPDTANHNFIYCTGVSYPFTGNANPGPIATSLWHCYPPPGVPLSSVTFNPPLVSTTGISGESITFSLPGTYTLGLACNSYTAGIDSGKLVVVVKPTPTVTVSPISPFICNGSTTGVDLTATGALTYSWTTNTAITVDPTPLNPSADTVNVNPASLNLPQAFVYSVTGTAADGCVSPSVTDTVWVISPPNPYYVAIPDTICAGLQTTLYVDSMPINTTYTWTANFNCGLGSNSGQFVHATPIYPSGANCGNDSLFNYQVQINVPGCPPYQPHTLSVLVLPLPKILTAPDTIDDCNHTGATLSVTTTCPAANVGLSWTQQGVFAPLHGIQDGIPSDTNKVFVNPLHATTYYVTPVNQYGCRGLKDSVKVMVGDTVNAVLTSEFGIICDGTSDTLIANTTPQYVTSNVYHYSWAPTTPTPIFWSSVTGDTVVVYPTSNTIYTVTIDGTCVKHNKATFPITVNNCTPPIVVFSASTHTICVGHCIIFKDSTQYLSTKPLYYNWSFPGGAITNPPSGSTVVGGNTLLFSMTDNSPLNPVKVCYSQNSLLNNPGGYFPVIDSVTNGIGQIRVHTDSVKVYKGPIAVAGNNQTIDQGSSATLCSTGSSTVTGTTFNWAEPDSSFLTCPDCPCTSVTPSVTTQFTLTLTDASGCVDSTVVTVFVDIVCNNVFVANAFSPNGDGLNDVLHVKSNCPITNMSFKIFDRWGEMIFESTDESIGWDGTYKSKLMDTGVFMYTLDGYYSTGKEVKKKGNVTLLR